MLAVVHLLVCLLLIRLFSLDRNQAFMILLFGFLIDLDHIFGLVDYIYESDGTNLLSIKHAMASNIEWKSLMHQPMALIIVGPLAIMFTYALPLLSWALHLLMDYAQINYLGIASLPEMVLTISIAALLIWNDFYKCRLMSDEPIGLRGFLEWEFGQVKGEAKQWVPSWTRRAPVST